MTGMIICNVTDNDNSINETTTGNERKRPSADSQLFKHARSKTSEKSYSARLRNGESWNDILNGKIEQMKYEDAQQQQQQEEGSYSSKKATTKST